MRRVLVTGGSGFIGSHLVDALLGRNDCEVLNLDCLTYAGSIKNTAKFADYPTYSFQKLDIRGELNVAKAVEEFDPNIVFHLAAESHVDNSIENPSSFIQTNVVGTYNLLRACQQLKYLKKFIYVSTDEVYGSIATTDLSSYEKSPLQPNSPYSSSKAAAGLIVRSWHQTYDFPSIITRCSNNYGIRQHPEKLIPKTIINLFSSKPIPVYGDGSNIRDWIHVEDHCSALMAVMDKGEVGEIYNIGADYEISNIDLVNKICDEYGSLCRGLITFVKDRPGHDFRYSMRYDKIYNTLKWEPVKTFDESLEEITEWYEDWFESNRDWWKNEK